MRHPMLYTLAAVIAAAPLGAAWAASGDAPVSPNGAMAAPRAEAGSVIAPTLGTGSADPGELRSRGATLVGEQAVEANGLATVAYGKIGAKGESIINWDSRTRSYTLNYPTRAIVYIEYGGGHLCTGWMYANNMVATAGHCVHTGGSSGSWRSAANFRVYPGRDGSSSPYGSCGVTRLYSVAGWVSSGNYQYDYAAMRLNCTIGATVGTFGMYDDTSPIGHPAIIGGYPGDKPKTQWTSADKIRTASSTMLAYRMDTVGGHSGSPIWHDRSEALSSNGAWAIGVHNYGVGAIGSTMNGAARLNATRISNYNYWRTAP